MISLGFEGYYHSPPLSPGEKRSWRASQKRALKEIDALIAFSEAAASKRKATSSKRKTNHIKRKKQ